MTSRKITKMITDAHKLALGKKFSEIIFCGGITRSEINNEDDIDYIVVVKNICPATTYLLSTVRQNLSASIPNELSNTVVTKEELSKIDKHYYQMDGKAVQAIIDEGNKSRKEVLLPDSLISFSRLNYYSLRSLLLKMLIRSSTPIDIASRKKMAKIGLIMIRMISQYFEASNKQQPALNEEKRLLCEAKVRPSEIKDDQLRNVLLSVMNERL